MVTSPQVGQLMNQKRGLLLFTKTLDQIGRQEQAWPAAQSPNHGTNRFRQNGDCWTTSQPESVGEMTGLRLQPMRCRSSTAQHTLKSTDAPAR
jgi:hypothetical protein